MNILIYIPYINKSSGGVLQYSKCLLNILAKDKTNNYYIFFRNNYTDFNEFSSTPNFKILPNNETNYRTSLFNIFEKISFNFLSILNKLHLPLFTEQPNVLDKVIKKYKIDILHCPFQLLPTKSIPVISTLHDIQEIHFPENFSIEQLKQRRNDAKKITENASKIIVSYQHIKDDIIRYFNKSSDLVEVVLLNMQNLWFEKFVNNALYKSIKLEGIPNKFILYPAATWKHKNHTNLLKAIAFIKNIENLKIHLVCTGHKTEYFLELEKLIVELGIQNQVIFLGEVSEEKLYALYKNCQAVVVPTLYEAGSFPLMESILLNIPCVCSNVTSLPETMNNNLFVFDPNNIEDIVNKIISITTDEDIINICINNYKDISKNLTDTHSLEKILYIYKGIRNTNSHHNQ